MHDEFTLLLALIEITSFNETVECRKRGLPKMQEVESPNESLL